MKLLLIDNYDSFTYNLYQLMGGLGVNQIVVRNDEIGARDIAKYNPDAIMISPGPKTPADSGVSCAVIRAWAERIPILGVCLGMQCIAEVFGGRVVRAAKVMHGKTSMILHEGTDLFRGIPSPCRVARYHSLVVENLPDCIEPTAHTEDGVIMAIRHRAAPVWGVQFHPESFLSEYGETMMQNFISAAEEYNRMGRSCSDCSVRVSGRGE